MTPVFIDDAIESDLDLAREEEQRDEESELARQDAQQSEFGSEGNILFGMDHDAGY